MTVERLAQLIQVEPARYSVRFWLALLGLVFFLLVAFSSVSDRASGHEWGIAVQREGEGLRVVWVQPSGVASDAGVRPGDFVIAIDGLPSAVVEPSKIDEATTVTTADEQSTNISTMSAYGGMGTVLALGLLAAGVVFMVIGTSVLLWAPNVEEALAFYAFSSVSAVIYVLALSAYSGHLWNVRLQFIMTTLSFTCLAYLFLVFPKNRIRGLAPKSYIALFTPAIALITLFLIASLGWHSIYGAVRPLAYASDILWVLVAAIAFLWSFIELRREGAAGRLMAPIIGTAFAAIGIVFTTVLPLGLAREPLIPPETSALFGVLIPASFAYAILRHRLLGLSGIIRRAMISSFVGVALLASFVALSFAANRTLDVDPSNDALDLGLQILFLAIALVILPALQRLMQDFVDRVFFREVYQHDKALRNITRSLSSIGAADDVASHVVATLSETLNLSFAGVHLLDVGGHPGVIATAPGKRADVAKTVQMAVEVASTDGQNGVAPVAKVGNLDVTCVRLVSGGAEVGMLCLGPKESGLGLSQRDINLVTDVATHLAMGLDNARLLQMVRRNLAELETSASRLRDGQRQLRELNHRLLMAEEQERRRLAADLHDEPLQRIMMLMRHMEGCPGTRGASNAKCRSFAEEAATALRRACVDFHPPLLEDLGLEAALDWLVSNTNKSSSLDARIEIARDVSQVKLSSRAQIALYRVVQEALNNAVRHSAAASVLVSLSVRDHSITASVRDDGRGFQMPESLANLSIDGHMGLIGMRERIGSIGGRIKIRTAPGQGTEVTAVVKYESKAASHTAAETVEVVRR